MGTVGHYLFGELEQLNTSQLVPSDPQLRQILDCWLLPMIQVPEEVGRQQQELERLCRAWQRETPRDELGMVSLPLPAIFQQSGYEHLVAHIWFNWASRGRVSRSGHAFLLPASVWRQLRFNPFELEPAILGAAEFSDLDRIQTRLGTLNWRRHLTDESAEKRSAASLQIPRHAPLLIPNWNLELARTLVDATREEDRHRLRCWSGMIGVSREYRRYFHLGVVPTDLAHDGTEQATARWESPQGLQWAGGRWPVSPEELPQPTVGGVSAAPRVVLGPVLAGVDGARPPAADASPRMGSGAGSLRGVALWLMLVFAFGALAIGAWRKASEGNRFDDRVEQWRADTETVRSGEIETLLEEALAILDEDPDGRSIKQVAPRLERLSETIYSRIVESSNVGNGTPELLSEQKRLIQQVDALRRRASFPLSWDPQEQMDRVWQAEVDLVELHECTQGLAARVDVLHEIEALASGSEVPQNPLLPAVRRSTERCQADRGLDQLLARWRELTSRAGQIVALDVTRDLEAINAQPVSEERRGEAEQMARRLAGIHRAHLFEALESRYTDVFSRLNEETLPSAKRSAIRLALSEYDAEAERIALSLAPWPDNLVLPFDEICVEDAVRRTPVLGLSCGSDLPDGFCSVQWKPRRLGGRKSATALDLTLDEILSEGVVRACCEQDDGPFARGPCTEPLSALDLLPRRSVTSEGCRLESQRLPKARLVCAGQR